jgi:hypothetical protein
MTYSITCHHFLDTNVETGGDKWDTTCEMLVMLYMWEVKSDTCYKATTFLFVVSCLVMCL